MKKALVAGILGLALHAVTSYGQGYIIFRNYQLVSGTPVYSGVTYGPGSGAKTGQFVGNASGFKSDLLYSIGGAAYSLAAGSQTAFYGTQNGAPVNSQDGGSPTTDGAGSFFGATVTIPGYTSGPINFIVEAYNGSSYAASVSGNLYAGQSAPFTINSLQINSGLPADDVLQLNGGTTPTGLQAFTVTVPEPSIFALAGLGAAGLMAFRRKK